MYWNHKFKHLGCGAHFIMCSDYENWPSEGKTTPDGPVVHCPECGGTTGFLHWRQSVEGFIFESVPGEALVVAVH